MRNLVVALLLLATAAAAGDLRRTPVGRAVQAYLAEVPLEGMAATAASFAVPWPTGGRVADAPFVDVLAAVGSPGLLSAPAQGGSLGWASLRLDFWLPAVDGSVQDQGGGEVDARDDLGLDSNEFTLVPRALVSLGGVGILVDAYVFRTQGSGTLTTTVTFGGVSFVVSEDVDSDLDLANVRGLLTVPVVKAGFLQISLLGGISYYDIEVTIRGSISGTGTATAQLPVPLIGVLGQARLGSLLLEVEVAGLTADYGDYDVNYLDAQASVGVVFLKIVAVRAGYRVTTLDGTIEGVDFDGTLDGFFVGASVNF